MSGIHSVLFLVTEKSGSFNFQTFVAAMSCTCSRKFVISQRPLKSIQRRRTLWSGAGNLSM